MQIGDKVMVKATITGISESGNPIVGFESGGHHLVKKEDIRMKQPPERKDGEWEETEYKSVDQTGETYYDGIGFRCSNCANVFKVTSLVRYHFCPNCGARMKE